MNSIDRLRAVFDIVVDEARSNSAFRSRLEDAMEKFAVDARVKGKVKKPERARKGGRRAAGVIDPFGIYRESPEKLRESLGVLSVDQLKDIVSEHGMDTSKLALKWRDSERLITLIIETVGNRLAKGDAFRS